MTGFTALERLVKLLPEPTDFFTGVSGPLTTLPHKILAFTRTRTYLNTDHYTFHHRFTLLVAMRGQGGVILNGQQCLLEPEQALLIFPYQTHYFTKMSSPALYWLFVAFDYDQGDELAPLRDRTIPFTEPARQVLREALAAYTAGRDDAMAAATTTLALARVLTICLATDLPATHAQAQLPSDEKAALVSRMSRYVRAQMELPLSPAMIAAHVGVSESHARALFRETVGLSLGKFIREEKIYTACHLLHTTDQSVTEIAHAVGYDSLFSFSRAFHQIVQQSPQQFRRQRQWQLP